LYFILFIFINKLHHSGREKTKPLI